ncbi:hypothetical protein MTR_1g038280 [Medicago truncatula]|uniref:Uncharacterized protein n=1 Tax=Medicago truncatula TaxID=3880 RepID=G7IA43_MEDTR|nr:hypothetical protein MTR_1g038280 [Medicago truncatula]
MGDKQVSTNKENHCSPSSVWISHWGGSYFMSIIDDYSRRVWDSILKNKSDAFEKFKE